MIVLGSALLYTCHQEYLLDMLSLPSCRRIAMIPFPLLELEYYFGPSASSRVFELVSEACASVDELVVPSRYCEQEFRLRKFIACPLRIVRLGVADSWRGQASTYVEPHFVSLSRMSRYSRHKNVDVLLEAWEGFVQDRPGMTLVLIGEGSRSLALHRRNIAPIENASDAQIRSHLRQAVALIHPSSIEAFGLSILESLASGTPVIAANSTAIPELVREGVNGTLVEITTSSTNDRFSAPDPARLCERIEGLAQDFSLRTVLASNAASSVADLTWEGTVTSLAID